jgi:formate hydrogenlyase subunit 4
MDIFFSVGRTFLILVAAPLLSGIIKTAKARLQNRRGSSIFQVYFDLWKLLGKDSVISPTVSWIFLIAPFIYFASVLAAAVLLPGGSFFINGGDDLIVFIYVLALGRFFLVLASLDAGSSFGGMGGAREMFIAVLVEPVLLMTMLTVALKANTTNLWFMADTAAGSPFSLPYVFSAIAFFMIVIVETGRIPVDNPDTHLELTMIHEGMVLEYSGRKLGLIFWASAVKQMVMIILFIMLFLPWNLAAHSFVINMVWFLAKIVLVALALAFAETITNKMRLFKVPGFLAAAGLLSLLALIAQ